MRKIRWLMALAFPLVIAACEKSPTAPGAPSEVAVKFGLAPAAGVAASLSPSYSTSGATGLTIQGTNGVLNLTDVGFIVAELEIERLEKTCENTGSGNLCDDYEAPISFVKLPLAGGAVEVASDALPFGQYDELDFEVESLDLDTDDDATEQQQKRALLASIRAAYPAFPSDASLVVAGTFTPTGGQPVPFVTFFDAEIKVELRFDPPLTVNETGVSQALTVDVQPALWFKRADGSVWDLSAEDFSRTGKLVEFELEVSKGFAKVEVGKDD